MTYYYFVLAVLILFLTLLINKIRKQKLLQERINIKKDNREKYIVKVKDKAFDENGFNGETKKEIISCEKLRLEILERVTREDYEEEEINEELEKYMDMNVQLMARMKQGESEWEKALERLEDVKANGVSIISESNYYPHEFAYQINDLGKYKEEINTNIQEDPLHSTEEVLNHLEEFNQKLLAYQEIKTSILNTIENSTEIMEGLNTEMKKDIIQLKQDLYLGLQSGNISDCKRLSTKLNNTLKRAKANY